MGVVHPTQKRHNEGIHSTLRCRQELDELGSWAACIGVHFLHRLPFQPKRASYDEIPETKNIRKKSVVGKTPQFEACALLLSSYEHSDMAEAIRHKTG
jgi:hypothetical protein